MLPANPPTPTAEQVEACMGEARTLILSSAVVRAGYRSAVHSIAVALASRDATIAALRAEVEAAGEREAALIRERDDANRGARSARVSRDAVLDTEARHLRERNEARTALAAALARAEAAEREAEARIAQEHAGCNAARDALLARALAAEREVAGLRLLGVVGREG